MNTDSGNSLRFTILFYLPIIFFTMACHGVAAEVTSPVQEPRFSIEMMKQDVEFLVNTLCDVHFSLSDAEPRIAELRSSAKQIKAQLTEPLTQAQFFVRLAPLVTGLEDGHTQIFLPAQSVGTYRQNHGTVIPLDVTLVDDCVYVLHYYSTDAELPVGAELLSINQVPMGEILQRMDTALSGEREDYRRTWLQGKGNDYFKVLLWILYGFKESFHIQYRQGEAISQAHLQGVDSQTLKTIRESSFPSQPPWRYQRQKDNIGLLTIKTFQAKAEEFQRFLGTSFKQIRKEGIEYLIIDLRGNRGGSSDLADKLLSYLSPKPFNVTPWIQIRVSRQAKDQFKQRVPGLVRWLPVQNLSPRGRAVWKAKEGSVITFEEKPVKPKAEHQRYHGKIYLLIDEGTFSTAAILADVIHRHGMGTLIGRETGGLAGCTWGEPLFFETPHCDVRFSVAAMQFQQAEALSDVNGQGVIPHFSVVNELSHTIQKNDAILEKAMTLISSDMEQRGTE